MDHTNTAARLLCEAFGRSAGSLSNEAAPFRSALADSLNNPRTPYWSPLVAVEANRPVLLHLAMFLTSQETDAYSASGQALLQLLADAGHVPSMCARGQLLISGGRGDAYVSAGVELLQKAHVAGSDEAGILLAGCYMDGTGVPKNVGQAYDMLRQSQGHPEAQYRLGCGYISGEVATDYKQGISLLQTAAARGHAGACYELGNILFAATDKSSSCSDALVTVAKSQVMEGPVALWQKAAEAGHPVAQFNLACCYRKGILVERNVTTAMSWARRAAELGYSRAQFYLGKTLLGSKGDGEDATTGVQWLLRAAEDGLAEAQMVLSQCFRLGHGTTQHTPLALQYLLAAADRGHPRAQHQLALEYFSGQNVPRDVEKGMVWLEHSADSGCGQGHRFLSQFYFTGSGKLKDEEMAFKHALLGAELGEKVCMHNVAYLFANGVGVEKNEEQARLWAERAAAPTKPIEAVPSNFVTADCFHVNNGPHDLLVHKHVVEDVAMPDVALSTTPATSAAL
mmetsp:Transcript_16683/g.65179  ORF Transcript_16683/g.65179 Transcript_16683/m.65179 type:complete len:511 (+) Transcript_16683:211-1743(+)